MTGDKPLTAGEYDFTVHCVNSFTSQGFGTFTGAEFFTDTTAYNTGSTATPTSAPAPTGTEAPTVSPTPTRQATPVPTPAPGAAKSMTILSVIRVPLPFHLGSLVIPLAIVAPRKADGTVQFFDNDTLLGGSLPVVGGVASGPFGSLGVDNHSVTAIFAPTDPDHSCRRRRSL